MTQGCNWYIVLVLIMGSVQCAIILLDRYGLRTREIICGDTSVLRTYYMQSPDTFPDKVNELQKSNLRVKSINGSSSSEVPRQPSKTNANDTDIALPANANTIVQPTTEDLPKVFEGVKARAFDPWPKDRPLPCFEPEENWKNSQQSPARVGFIFLKPYKTGSSTSSGINLRIAKNEAHRQSQNFEICKARSDHAWASQLYSNRDPNKTFLWTIVRNPTKRIISQFFHFQVSRNKIEPTDANFINYVRKKGPADMIHDYYLVALSLIRYQRGKSDAVAFSNQILQDYDFVGITERMDESAVAMAMLLGIPIADVLYLSAKGQGGFDDGGGRKNAGICTYIWPSFVSEGMQEFLDSDEWKEKSHRDNVFYQAANRSLDLTIDRLGREEFNKNLQLYRKALERAREQCLHRTKFPCSPGGKRTPYNQTDCLWMDSGCGNDCLDEVSTDMALW